MKKILLSLAAASAVACAFAFPKALYVKQGDEFTKYNFGVAGDLHFENNGRTLWITGYDDVIDLDKVDYITFNAPVDDTGLTPSEQKEKLVAIGDEVYSMVDLNDNADLLNMIHVFFDNQYDKDNNWIVAPVNYTLDPSYYDFHSKAEAAVRAIGAIVKGDLAAARVLKAAVADIYKAEDYFGVYTANSETLAWDKTKADYLEIRFASMTGVQYSVRLDASPEYSSWDNGDIEVRLPRKMDISVKMDGKTLATAALTSNLVKGSTAELSLDFEANGYKVVNTLNVVNTLLTDRTVVTVKGKQLCDVTSEVTGRNLVDFNEMYDAAYAATHHHDENNECVDADPTELIAHFFRAKTEVDVIGKLQVKAKLAALSKVYDTLSLESYVYDEVKVGNMHTYCSGKVLGLKDDVYSVTCYDTDILEKQLSTLNSYGDAAFFYDGKKRMEGFMSWDYTEDSETRSQIYGDIATCLYAYTVYDGFLVSVRRDEIYNDNGTVKGYSDWYFYVNGEDENGNYVSDKVIVDASKVVYPEGIRQVYYDVMPQLVFPDLTSFAADDFFDSVSFSKLIDDYNSIINSYLSITGQDNDEEPGV